MSISTDCMSSPCVAVDRVDGAQVDVVVAPNGFNPLPGHLFCGLAVISFDGREFLENVDGTAILEPGDTSEIMRLRVRTSPPGAYHLQCTFPTNSLKIVQYIVTEF
jgi:hypothetical protein